jgi:glutathione S-transferase
MYQLYYYPDNASLAPHMVLEEIGAPFELVFLDRTRNAHKAPDYLKLNPHGRIPTLVDGDLVLYEAVAICLHLTDYHPTAGLAPEIGSVERAHFYKWLIYLTNTVQAEMPLYYYPHRWADDDSGAASVKRHAEARMGKNGRHVLIGMLRQSVFGRIAGYQDVNDADRLADRTR